ncbi:MAG: phosphoglycerate kinase, partial [Alphaproteobacteria bacterium]|nr:phosphoglycerate kinase [Alphaproteobacteria bacterium]
KMISDIQPTDVIMDEGPKSVAEYERAIDNAATIVWNGTVGMAEWPPVWSRGTFTLAKHVAIRTRAGKLESIIGGGDAAAAMEAAGVAGDMTYISTGGGAFLEFIEGRELPGIKALEK